MMMTLYINLKPLLVCILTHANMHIHTETCFTHIHTENKKKSSLVFFDNSLIFFLSLGLKDGAIYSKDTSLHF